MNATIEVHKSLFGDWQAYCYECALDHNWPTFNTWAEAITWSNNHRAAHDSNRCKTCGHSATTRPPR